MHYSFLLLSALAYHAEAQSLPLYINAGPSSYVDSSGNLWVPDESYISTGSLYKNNRQIANTLDDKIYQEERWFSQSSSTYSIPISSGYTSVEVVLHFAEIFFGAENKRVFNVEINGELVNDSLDIVRAAGGNNRPLTVAHVVNVNCGQPSCSLDISLTKVKENPKISGIVVLPLTPHIEADAPVTEVPSKIAALRLIHAPTNVELLDLIDGMVINTEELGVTPEFNVKAVKSDSSVNRVQFLETGRSEGVEPFAFCGDSSGNYNVCDSLGLGSNTVTAIPYSGGQALPGMSVTFDVIGPTEPPTPSPVPLDPHGPRWIEVDWVEDVEDDDDAGIEARHEACFVMVGRRGYLVGGRGNKDTGIYDPVSRTWTKGAPPPIQMHHMQCVAAQGKLWVMAAWTDWYPRESNAEHGHVYDPATDTWSTRTAMPEARRRGGAAAVVSDDETKIYISHGNDGGHETSSNTAAVSLGYLDVYDIATDSWTALSDDAPNPRDHTGGAMVNGRICVAGGRNGGELYWPGVAPTDCYDLATGTWSVEADIPQVRGGSAYGTTCDGKLMVAGGEGSGRAWDQVDVFDGSSWTTVDSLVIGRHGTGLGVDCLCNQIHIASGASSQGGGPEIKSIETYFPNGVDEACF